MARKITAMKGVSRIDSYSTHGWFVRGHRNGKTHSKLFSDRQLGGKIKALKLAKVYRDELHAELAAIPQKARPLQVITGNIRNKTGELGVSRVTKISPSGTKYESYGVSWRPEPGVQKGTNFSIKKHGEEKAFKLAVALRRKMMREILGETEYRKYLKKMRSEKE